ncbi:MAG TPA: hypothetical protein VGM78_14615 [Ilumatobacteraceae bacterium]
MHSNQLLRLVLDRQEALRRQARTAALQRDARAHRQTGTAPPPLCLDPAAGRTDQRRAGMGA